MNVLESRIAEGSAYRFELNSVKLIMLTVHVLGNVFTAWRSVSVLVIIVDN